MSKQVLAAAFALTMAALGPALAQAPSVAPGAPVNPLDVVPDKMPFATPYGAPISLARAEALIKAATAEAEKHGWALNVAVTDSGGNLVAFARMDGAQLASVAVSEHKARAAVTFRRPTRVFEDGLQLKDFKYILTLDGLIASRGGIPIIEDGKIIGGVGCSGGTGSQDDVACAAAAATINK